MIKKPQIIILIGLIAVAALFIIGIGAQNQAGVQSKASHAEKLWLTSGHADSTAEAFVHWDEDSPQEIPSRCSKCHSTHGAVSFFTTGAPATVPIGTTVECQVCHTDPEAGTVRDHTAVTFPSGAMAEELGPEAICMECHQGRASKKSVDDEIADAGVTDDDTISPSIGFINIHYFAAAANQFGTVADGGYEYAGKTYDARFSHVTDYNACNTCHDPHSLRVELGPCNTCHAGVTDPKTIRYYGSFTDYDGDGNMEEGMYDELEGLKPILYQALQTYANDVTGYPIAYDSHAYPYFFNDTNANGMADSDEASYGNRYTSFSARLLKAAYNYQVSLKDPAGYAHGGKYIIQLMYDSIMDLNSVLPKPITTTNLHRGDEGHFDGSTEAWRHWDEDGEVSTRCAKCHTATGLQAHVQNGGVIAEAQETANGMLCTTCHFTGPPSIPNIGPVEFPSGVVEDLGDSSNLCLQCHQGRASKFTIYAKVAGEGPYSFSNIHYFPAAAVMFGSEVAGGFEYAGKAYAGQKLFTNHMGQFDTCVECHMGTKSKGKIDSFATDFNHNVHKPNPADCVFCHGQDVSQPKPGSDPAKFKFSGIRPATTPDYDGDGDRKESIKNEIKELEEELYTKLQAYGNKIGSPIIYDSHAYPYFFKDTNGNGKVDPGENIYPNAYEFNAKMLKSAYNYQMSLKEPHGFIHNSKYVAQLLVDSIVDLGGDSTKYTWR